MQTKKVEISGTSYTIAPLNYAQYEQTFFDDNLEPLKRAHVGDVIRFALENANFPDNPKFEDIPAADVLDLWPEVLAISRLAKGEVNAPKNQDQE